MPSADAWLSSGNILAGPPGVHSVLLDLAPARDPERRRIGDKSLDRLRGLMVGYSFGTTRRPPTGRGRTGTDQPD